MKRPDPVAWAKTTRRDRGGSRCKTCSDPAVSAVIDKWVPLLKSGEMEVSVPQMRRYLARYCGYKLISGSLRYCLVTHRGVELRPHGE